MTDRFARIWFALFVLVVFASGFGAGVLMDRSLWRPRAPVAWGPSGPPGGGPGRGLGRFGGRPPAVLAERLTRELGLSVEQATRVRAVLDARRGRLSQVRDELQAQARTRFEAEQQALRDELRGILTAEQLTRLDEVFRRGPPFFGPPGRP